MNNRSPILVTGSHRSGSTWVGRMISTSHAVGYISEPFNLNHGFTGATFDHWFTYVTHENEDEYYRPIKRALEFHYDLLGELRATSSLPYLWRAPRDYLLSLWHRAHDAIPLVKDPIAVLSSAWLAERFDMRVLVLVRHPAAFVSSLKVKGWTFPFCHFLQQPLLMRDWLQPFKREIREQASVQHKVIDQGILLWKIIYHVLTQYRRDHPDWLFLRHEDVARNPINRFRSVYEALSLDFSPRVRNVVRKHTTASNPAEEPRFGSYVRRDSKALVSGWKDRLTPGEIRRIREGVRSIADNFYSDADW